MGGRSETLATTNSAEITERGPTDIVILRTGTSAGSYPNYAYDLTGDFSDISPLCGSRPEAQPRCR